MEMPGGKGSGPLAQERRHRLQRFAARQWRPLWHV